MEQKFGAFNKNSLFDSAKLLSAYYSFLPLLIVFLFAFNQAEAQSRNGKIGLDTLKVVKGYNTELTISRNGRVTEITRLKNGNLHGVQEKYAGEKLKEQTTYSNGFYDGESLIFDSEGNILERKNFKFDQTKGHSLLNGVYEKYKGKTLNIRANYKDSLKSGKYEEFDYKGNLRISMNYAFDLPSGKKTEYYDSRPTAISNYKIIEADGKKKAVLHGKSDRFHANGVLNSSGKYNNDLKDGLWTAFTVSGILESEQMFKAGKKAGKYTIYHDNKTIKEQGILYQEILREGVVVKGNFYDGKREGFYRNGIPEFKEVYKMGLKHGTFKRFHVNGIPSEKQEYENNLQTGLVEYWDQKGSKTFETFYRIYVDSIRTSLKDGAEYRWEDSVLVFESNFIRGKEDGVRKGYKNGKLTSEVFKLLYTFC